MGGLWTDAWTYVRAVVRHWGQLLAGALVAAIGVAAAATSFAIPSWVWWAIASLFFAVAQFRAFRDVRRQLDEIQAEGASAADRLRRLRGHGDLTGETFNPLELVEPGVHPQVQHRVFTDCDITGPAMIHFPARVTTHDNALPFVFVAPPRMPVVGGVIFVECTFDRCRFEGTIAIFASEETAKMLTIGGSRAPPS